MAALYEPSPWQQRFHDAQADEVLGAGSQGPGKSMALLMDPIVNQLFVEHARMTQSAESLSVVRPELHDLVRANPIRPGASKGWALHLRRQRPMLAETIERSHTIFPEIDPGAKYNAVDHRWEFSCGYKLEFGHCQHSEDWISFRSREFTHHGWDELIQFEPMQYEHINLRLRTSDPVLQKLLRICACTNPVSDERGSNFLISDPMWVRKRFVDPCREGNKLLRRKVVTRAGETKYATRLFLPATLYDNPNKDFVEQQEKSLLLARPHVRQALLYGDWYVTVGSYFGDVWNANLHVCKAFRVPDSWPQFRSMDWGHKSPGCVHWWAMDEDENLYCTKELTFKGKSDEEVAEIVKQVEQGMGLWDESADRSLVTGPADTQLWEERGDTGRTKAAAFLAKGVPWTKADKAKGSRLRNAERIYARLKDHDNGTTTPGLVIMDCCPKLIQTIPAIQTDPDDINLPADGGDDHWFDSAAYAHGYASRGRIGVTMVSTRDETQWGRRRSKDRDDPDRGRDGYGGTL